MVRFKVRWVLFEVVEDPVVDNGKVVFPKTSFEISENIINTAIRQAIAINYGEFGSAAAWGATVKWYNPATRTGIIRVPRELTDLLISSMFFMKQIDSIPCSFRILHVAGTIIRIQKAAIERDRALYLEEQTRAEKSGNYFNVVENMEKSEAMIQRIADA
ncbi:uncharacterized protein BYT42DRAFT_134059 [Radiomyces spectabilis]|uniref:uncharacterized protein n=1 Tax=Radiomyces spectabilis TaxID=64574 RepID=UPI002220B526|nr:uncharacterized protein BYT42DRAFT_134059 [Radiomyces spectabilis]KAI8367647.1 hypothetical protein BYT42DRAFT_134059 [Radiomyces spectabilis]